VFDGQKEVSRGRETFVSSRLWIFASVSGVGPQTFRRWFHVPFMIVHPVLDECVMVSI